MTTPTETPPANLPPPPVFSGPPSRAPFYRQIDFWLGFVAWYLFNGLVWSAMGGGVNSMYGPVANIIVLPGNVLVLLIAALVRRRFAGGILAAVAVNLVIALILGAFTNAVCAIPFFVR